MTLTHSLAKYPRAKLFQTAGTFSPAFVRFSTVAGEHGSAGTDRDPRGFAMKFYTEAGNWDPLANNTPVFFVRDRLKFQDFIHRQKRHPQTGWRDPTMPWGFSSQSPESLHQVSIRMGDRGTPAFWRHMNGYSSHTYSR